MAAGTKHFMFNRPDDWTGQGVADGLSAESGGLSLHKAGKGVYVLLWIPWKKRPSGTGCA